MKPSTRSAILRYGLAVLSVALTLLLTMRLRPILEQSIFVLFITAVMVSAWYGGLWPGLLSTFLSVLAIDYFLQTPPGELTLDWNDIPTLIVFVLLAFVISSLNEARKQSTERLRETNQMFNTLIQSSPLAIIVLDSSGIAMMWSPAAERIFGWSKQEVLGTSLPTIPPEQFEEFRANLDAFRKGNSFNGFETSQKKKDGELIHCSVWASSLPGKQDDNAAFLWIADDITERKRAEEALRSLTDALKSSDQLKSAVLASISHDLRTPLTSIRAAIDNLLQKDFEWDQATLHELHVIISEEVTRLARLVENLLEMARIEAGELHLSKNWESIPEIWGNVFDRCAPSLNHHSVVIEGSDALPLVNVDSRLVAQALANLVENAAKYSPPESEIVIRARLEGDQLLISVTDQGPGIPPDDIDRVFDKFYRSNHRTARQQSGTGMGLAIARGIVEAHGGRIWGESIAGEGATFTFTLPVEHQQMTGPTDPGGE